MRVRIPFQQRWRESMLTGNKVCTSRGRRFGKPGDTFEAFGADFELQAVEKMPLGDVKDSLYLQEGCESPEEFQRVWTKLNPRRGFVPEQQVHVHWFIRKNTAGRDVGLSNFD